MKKILFFLALLGTGLAGYAQNKFVLKGKIENLEQPSRAYLSYRLGDESFSDSVDLQNGRFRFRGQVAEPVQARLLLKPIAEVGAPRDFRKLLEADEQIIYLEKGKIRVEGKGQLKLATVKGGEAQSDYNRLQEMIEPIMVQMRPISSKALQLYVDKEMEARDALLPQIRALRKQVTEKQDQFIADNPDSWVSLYLLQPKAVVVNPVQFDPLYNALSERMRNSKLGKQLGHKLEMAWKTAVGQMAIPFTQNDTLGNPVSLASLRGKYVLIDFWASWCGPCRAENPNLVKAYAKYKPKNFEILGVSLDDKKAAWLAAIHKDGLTWQQVSDLKGWENEVAKEYGVTAVPQNFLIGPDGRIVAVNLRGEALEKRLEEILK